jgi:hypothetical protein
MTFRNRRTQAALAVFPMVVIVIGLAMATVSDQVVGSVYLVIGLLLLWRALTSHSVVLDNGAVRLRHLTITKTLSLDDVRKVHVESGRPGNMPYRREYLVFELHDGNERRFGDFSAPIPRPSGTTESPVRLAAEHLDRAARAARGDP